MKKTSSLRKIAATSIALAFTAAASHAALTTTFIGGGVGSAVGDTATGAGSFTLNDDTAGGDIWDGGDTLTYLHEASQITNSFTATVRVIGQTEDANGRWGKGGVQARASLDPLSSSAMAQVAAGTGSQVAVPTVGGHSPVPIRLAGQIDNIGAGGSGYEDAIQMGGVDVPNDVFPEGAATNVTWLSLSWDSTTNAFIAGAAPDVAGSPGVWSFSAPRTNVLDDAADGWYIGTGYSAHDSLSLPAAGGTEGQHGVMFDNWSLVVVPEPSSALLGVSALALFALRRRR